MLYEATVFALAEFRRCGFANVFFGLATGMAIQQLPVAWFRAVASVVAYGLATNRTDSEVMAPSLPVTSRRILTSFVFGP